MLLQGWTARQPDFGSQYSGPMSRTYKGSNPPGHEWWSRRPLPFYSNNAQHKQMCHQIERAQGKQELHAELAQDHLETEWDD
jgi:hypothetical protein